MNPIFTVKIDPLDPVYRNTEDGKWYYYDETWTDCGGPYETETEARHKLAEYIEYIGGEREPTKQT